MRARTDPNFSELLIRIGNGNEPTNDDDMIVIPKEMVIEYLNDDFSEQQLIDCIFPSLHQNFKSADRLYGNSCNTRNEK